MKNSIASTIVQLNSYDPEKYNVLVPVTTMQVVSNLQRITVSEVLLDTRQDRDNRGQSKDIYYERSSGKYAITKVGGMKLAAAADISIISTESGRTEGCQRCIEMARATGKPRVCGTCEHIHDVAVTVTIRVPEPSGGFRVLKATKEIDCTLEASGMKDGVRGQQYKRFLPHRTAMAESKAYMRAIRAALGLAGAYELAELKKPFIVARIVPNLDAPEIKEAVASSYLQSIGLLFETPAQTQTAGLPAPTAGAQVEVIPEYPDETPEQTPKMPEQTPETPEQMPWGDPPEPDWEPELEGFFCADCGQELVETRARNGNLWKPEDIAGFSERRYGRRLCPSCQERARGGQKR